MALHGAPQLLLLTGLLASRKEMPSSPTRTRSAAKEAAEIVGNWKCTWWMAAAGVLGNGFKYNPLARNRPSQRAWKLSEATFKCARNLHHNLEEVWNFNGLWLLLEYQPGPLSRSCRSLVTLLWRNIAFLFQAFSSFRLALLQSIASCRSCTWRTFHRAQHIQSHCSHGT